jgi:acyl-[acyl-carrier-protein]-phospholipid O-acyltransferase / long-chain-fatty-acid--[acyl-carrier-protein] ligase
MTKQIELLRARRFLPLLLTQTTGAFNDNLFKSAFIMLITYGAAAGPDPGVVAAIAGGALIAPFFLFSATAGELADRFERSRLLQILKAAEFVAVFGAAAALLTGNLALSLVLLFVLGTQAAFSSPVKYALLPQHLATAELVDGNALMEAGTFLSILAGTIAGGVAVAIAWGPAACCALLLVCAGFGFAASLRVPTAPAPTPNLRLSWNLLTATAGILRHAWERREVRLSILGASWFWLVGAVSLSQLPSFAKLTLGADSNVVVLFLAAFSIGVGAGSTLCGRLMHGEVSARYVPLAALGMTFFSFDLGLASQAAVPSQMVLIGIVDFLSQLGGLRIFGDLLGLAVSGGFFVVPLYAIIQNRSEEASRARIIAANNVVNALFMAGAAAVTAGLIAAAGLDTPALFLILGVANALVTVWICKLLPRDVLLMLARTLFRLVYRVEVRGIENVAAAGDRVIIVPNHVSFLDAPLVAAFLPGLPVFAIDPAQMQRWWVRPFLAAIDVFPMEPSRPMAAKSLIKAIKEGGRCVIFPEGRLNVTGGALMKVYDGPALIADKSEAMVLPVRLDGVEFTPFSRLAGRLRRRWFPKVTITILPPRKLAVPAALRGRARRHHAGAALYDIMSEMMARRPNPPSLFAAVIEARSAHGGGHRVIEDPATAPLTYDRTIAASLVLGRRLTRGTAPRDTVGLMLPNSVGAALAFLALQATGRVPAMLNHTAGADGVLSACRTAGLRRVITSRRFVELAKLAALAERLAGGVELVWLEDVREKLGVIDKLYGVIALRFVASLHRRLRISPSDPAAVLFTSGSEGAPKGVVLSHANLLGNRRQIAARVDFSPADLALNALPMFHSFGLTGGFLLPLLSGVRVFLYPSPLHYRIVPEIAYATGATILFGTDTFLAGYARRANPYDFYALRYVFAGAEAVRGETREIWSERFGKRILEGYGVTECSPVIAVNTPMHYRAGTVGRFLPLVEHRLEPVPGIADGGRLMVRGPNVMAGYLRGDNIEEPPDGWYDTGDIVTVDGEGFVAIIGRVKRFAKLGGEMVSLAAAERIAETAVPEIRHAVVALPDPRRGEKLILVTEAHAFDRTRLLEAAHELGLPEIAVPREAIEIDQIPLLGTGKTDYAAVTRLAEQAMAAPPSETAPVAPAALSLVRG